MTAAGRGATDATGGVTDASRLLRLSRAELDALFAAGDAGPVPDGEAEGTALVAPGTLLGRGMAPLVRRLVWRGKAFDAQAGLLVNRVTPLGLRAVAARVYEDASRSDGRPCLVLDYSTTSTIARGVRDELRRVGPGLYLGRGIWRGVRFLDFALAFRSPAFRRDRG